MQDNHKLFVKVAAETLELPDPVYEIGSMQVPGQEGYADLRPFFPGREYVGCDMREGPGVDRVENVESLSLPDASVGTIVMIATLEHVQDCLKALKEIHRVLRPGGVLLISSVMQFRIHEYPYDYWRFTPQAFHLLLREFDFRVVGSQGEPRFPNAVFGVGFKGGCREAVERQFVALRSRLSAEMRELRLRERRAMGFHYSRVRTLLSTIRRLRSWWVGPVERALGDLELTLVTQEAVEESREGAPHG